MGTSSSPLATVPLGPVGGSAGLRWLAWTLLVVWAALLFGGWALGPFDPAGRTRIPTWARMASSLALVAAAWAWHYLGCGLPAASMLIALGMTLGFIGDLAMADLLPTAEPVVVGMAAFGLGHAAYIAAFLILGRHGEGTALVARLVAWSLWILVGVLGWAVVVLPGTQPPALRGTALPYVLLLASTAGLAAGLAWRSPAFVPLAVGSALFFLSDLVLAAELFRNVHFRGIGDVIWLTYGPGQMLIVAGVPIAMALASHGLTRS